MSRIHSRLFRQRYFLHEPLRESFCLLFWLKERQISQRFSAFSRCFGIAGLRLIKNERRDEEVIVIPLREPPLPRELLTSSGDEITAKS